MHLRTYACMFVCTHVPVLVPYITSNSSTCVCVCECECVCVCVCMSPLQSRNSPAWPEETTSLFFFHAQDYFFFFPLHSQNTPAWPEETTFPNCKCAKTYTYKGFQYSVTTSFLCAFAGCKCTRTSILYNAASPAQVCVCICGVQVHTTPFYSWRCLKGRSIRYRVCVCVCVRACVRVRAVVSVSRD
jgi:hypothetical protein